MTRRSDAAVLSHRSLEVFGVRRKLWFASPASTSPLIVALHGRGGSGRTMAAQTRLAERGTAAGFAVAFPDGWGKAWGNGRRTSIETGGQSIDDDTFLVNLISDLQASGMVMDVPAYLIGHSNGALFSEGFARRGVLDVTGIALISASASELSRELNPRPRQSTAVLCIHGTGDPVVPVEGGPVVLPGVLSRISAARDRRRGEEPMTWNVAPTLDVMYEWARANGIVSEPTVTSAEITPHETPTIYFQWHGEAKRPVEYYRVEGGGHGWPGGHRALPTHLIGPPSHGVDATGLVLGCAAHAFESLGN